MGLPYADSPWNEVAPYLYVGGHDVRGGPGEHPVLPVKVGTEFDFVASFYVRGPLAEYGPPAGVDYVTYQIPDGELAKGQINRVLELALEVSELILTKKRVLVRCQAGYNRSALVAALALTELGHTPEQAIKQIRDRRSPYALQNFYFCSLIESMGRRWGYAFLSELTQSETKKAGVVTEPYPTCGCLTRRGALGVTSEEPVPCERIPGHDGDCWFFPVHKVDQTAGKWVEVPPEQLVSDVQTWKKELLSKLKASHWCGSCVVLDGSRSRPVGPPPEQVPRTWWDAIPEEAKAQEAWLSCAVNFLSTVLSDELFFPNDPKSPFGYTAAKLLLRGVSDHMVGELWKDSNSLSHATGGWLRGLDESRG